MHVCSPEYLPLGPLPDEEYPDTLDMHGRRRHPGYKNYTARLQGLGFYTRMHQLQKAGVQS